MAQNKASISALRKRINQNPLVRFVKIANWVDVVNVTIKGVKKRRMYIHFFQLVLIELDLFSRNIDSRIHHVSCYYTINTYAFSKLAVYFCALLAYPSVTMYGPALSLNHAGQAQTCANFELPLL